jgi:hypothetical protein
MNIYVAPVYTEQDIERLSVEEMHFPFTDNDAVYIGLDHQYELTSAYFQERGRNLEIEIEGHDPEKVKHFLKALRLKVYTWIYTHNKSTRQQLNYLIAVRSLRGFDKYAYRQAFLEAMFLEGCYLLDNGDLSGIAGVDLDTMQNMSADVMRFQDRDMHRDCIRLLQTLGLNYYGKYTFIPQGRDW